MHRTPRLTHPPSNWKQKKSSIGLIDRAPAEAVLGSLRKSAMVGTRGGAAAAASGGGGDRDSTSRASSSSSSQPSATNEKGGDLQVSHDDVLERKSATFGMMHYFVYNVDVYSSTFFLLATWRPRGALII